MAIATAEITDDYSADADGIYVPPRPVTHREDEYDSSGFDALLDMQSRHFWYRGRHRFLLHALRREMRRNDNAARGSAVDLGGGCGGWVRYLVDEAPDLFAECALADSSRRALDKARDVVGERVRRYQVDLLDVQWTDRWDVAFLLDVLEHIPDDVGAMRQVAQLLRPGGVALVATPALQCFWSYNDDLAHHVRRYSRRDYARLAKQCGLSLQWSRYFMFFLSPLLVGSRLFRPDIERMSPEEIRQHLESTHRVPGPLANHLLSAVFSAETPLGHAVPFPWGASVLAVLKKPR
ncbi:MAG: class I SAM-dependent methyltransferase [Pirellulaceae bacterium]